MSRVFVTGLGFICSIGNDEATVVGNLRDLKHGMELYPPLQTSDSPVKIAATDKEIDVESLEPEERPMHYRDLAKALEQRNIHIAGRDPGLYMSAHIHKDTRFCRPKRGHYALREWDPESQQNVGGHKKQRRSSR